MSRRVLWVATVNLQNCASVVGQQQGSALDQRGRAAIHWLLWQPHLLVDSLHHVLLCHCLVSPCPTWVCVQCSIEDRFFTISIAVRGGIHQRYITIHIAFSMFCICGYDCTFDIVPKKKPGRGRRPSQVIRCRYPLRDSNYL